MNIANESSSFSVKAEPNPFNSTLTLNVNISTDENIKLQIIDITGKLISIIIS